MAAPTASPSPAPSASAVTCLTPALGSLFISTPKPKPKPMDATVSSLTRDLSALAIKSPSKRKLHPKSCKKKPKNVPEFRYRVGAISSRTRPPSRESSRPPKPKSKPKGHVHVRIEARSRRHAMHRRHRVPSPARTV
ncbi:hypothetical protein CC85DRAFT_14429 [Cutaneotrichosporon oleaginosum]|uniref:Uncharacterized protein n=1 Tax=Cutaneotrichosporon oleaginosum TaxID=879819 RepID=A0A0J0XCM0_9TREE|nr:uncharacterized protein CC85DRAFT_14429 [Cutaneotrichosporon oleaginosum]KLT38815.1 hypothetical protein CC85DRAFT_14429 [Cutaneotrichosporon oleaginosum]TXT06203.1 hypothetical protein COLE_05534 [Cutaneotrichosporon oleaginosum]